MNVASRSIGKSVFILGVMLFLFVSCFEQPVSPYQPSNTQIYLSIKSPTLKKNIDQYVDTLGNSIQIGLTSNLPQFVDSVSIKICSETNIVEQGTFLKNINPSDKDPTWFSTHLDKVGLKYIIAQALIQDNFTYSDTITIVVVSRPVVTVPKVRPIISVTGTKNIGTAQTCTLTVTAKDTNPNQAHTFYVKQDAQPQTVFASPFIWTPPTGFTGTSTVFFKVSDTDDSTYFDTATVTIAVTAAPPINHAPKWANKTINEVGSPGNTINLTISKMCADPDGDLLTFSLVGGISPRTGTVITSGDSSIYSFAPGPGDTGTFYPQVIAKDPQGLSDTMTITFKISIPKIDSLPPTMAFVFPAHDSSSVSSGALTIIISCLDLSGVASVKCLFGTDSLTVTKSDSGRYSANVSNLKKGVFNTLLFSAIDSSAKANKGTLAVHVKFDSTIADNVAPILTLISPSKDTAISTDSSIVRVRCTDASAVASVVYALGAQTFTATKVSPTDSVYVATVKGLIGGAFSTVTITATDASPAHNVATASVKIKYDNDKTAPTLKYLVPAKDSTSVAGNSTSIQVICTDASAIAFLTCNAGTTPYTMTKSTTADSIWTGNITGLTAGQFTTLSLVATDASLSANKATLTLHIKYDPNMGDAQGPIITKVSGLATGARTAITNDTLVYTVTDASGVDTVSWSLNGIPSGVLTASANGRYSINAVLTRYHLDTIVITASDKSMNHNKSTDTTILDYNVAPKANDQNLSTKKNTALSITLTADPIDGDVLSAWMVLTTPVNGDLTGIAPALTYTPKAGVIGMDSLTFTVSDGKNTSNTAKIKINVSDVLVAPIAGKTIADVSVNKGALASFVATVNADVNPSPTFSWIKEGAAASISTSQTYTINQTAYSDQARYRCIISNSQGTDSSNWVTLTVKDIIAPVITLKGANPLSMTTGSTWTDPGATATDDRDGDISASIVVDISALKTTVAGSYTVNYDVKDKAGNAAITVKRTVNVADALVAPVAGKTIADISVNKGAAAVFAATVNAGINPAPTYSWVKEGVTAPVAATQTYTITATAYTDQARYHCIISNSQGKDSTNWITLTVKDVTAPVITLTGANPQQLQFNAAYAELGATASDDKDGNISSSIKIDATSVKTNIAGSYTVTYDVKDAAGNAAAQGKRTVTVASKPTYTLTVSLGSGGGGTVAPLGTVTVNQGDATPLTATPSAATGYMFDKWAVTTGAATLANPTSATAATVTLASGDATVTASFKLILCQLTLDAGTHGTRTVPASGSVVTVNYGVATDIAVTPGLGYSFTKWTTTDATVTLANANSAATKVTLTGAGKVAATYTLNQCVVNFMINGLSYSQVTVPAGNSVGAANLPAAPTPPNDSDFVSWQTPDNNAFDGTTVVWTSVNVTPKFIPILDADNNAYHTVTIGSYTWLKENLRTTQYTGGGSIGTANMGWYNGTPSVTYGALYTWTAANNPKIAPKGWHMATMADWENFMFNVGGGGGQSTMGDLMAIGGGWNNPDNPPTNSRGFSAYPSGYYANTGNPSGTVYWDGGVAAYWWYYNNTATTLDNWGVTTFIDPVPTGVKYSIRCVRDHP